jgi:ATP-dependent DNA ligase
LEQEFVIGGYTDPEGGRKHFGALLVGFYEGKRLKFAGRVGTGFSDKLLNSLRSELEKILMKGCPFYNVPAAGQSACPEPIYCTATFLNFSKRGSHLMDIKNRHNFPD